MAESTKPLPEPMFTYHQRGPVALIPGNVYLNMQDIYPHVVLEINTFEITATYPSAKWDKTIQLLQKDPHLPLADFHKRDGVGDDVPTEALITDGWTVLDLKMNTSLKGLKKIIHNFS